MVQFVEFVHASRLALVIKLAAIGQKVSTQRTSPVMHAMNNVGRFLASSKLI